MPTPPKPTIVLLSEKKSHRTKKELAQRQNAERSTLTGKKMQSSAEVRADKIANKEWKRICSLLDNIEKNDAIYEKVINRYCLLYSEVISFQNSKAFYESTIADVRKQMEDAPPDIMFKLIDKLNSLGKMIISLDKQINTKRVMMFNIEKENIMTIASALRSVPKTQSKKKSALEEALGG